MICHAAVQHISSLHRSLLLSHFPPLCVLAQCQRSCSCGEECFMCVPWTANCDDKSNGRCCAQPALVINAVSLLLSLHQLVMMFLEEATTPHRRGEGTTRRGGDMGAHQQPLPPTSCSWPLSPVHAQNIPSVHVRNGAQTVREDFGTLCSLFAQIC